MPICIATLRNNFITFQKTLVMRPRLKYPDFSTAFRGTLWISSPSASHSLIGFFLLRKRITQFAERIINCFNLTEDGTQSEREGHSLMEVSYFKGI